MEYTKGEWKVKKCDKDNAEVVFDDPEPSILIYTPYGNANANAHLIAASPDMYEALKEIWVMTAPKCHDSYIKSINDLCGKALAEAEGRNA